MTPLSEGWWFYEKKNRHKFSARAPPPQIINGPSLNLGLKFNAPLKFSYPRHEFWLVPNLCILDDIVGPILLQWVNTCWLELIPQHTALHDNAAESIASTPSTTASKIKILLVALFFSSFCNHIGGNTWGNCSTPSLFIFCGPWSIAPHLGNVPL